MRIVILEGFYWLFVFLWEIDFFRRGVVFYSYFFFVCGWGEVWREGRVEVKDVIVIGVMDLFVLRLKVNK